MNQQAARQDKPITHQCVVLLSPYADCLTRTDLDTTADVGMTLHLTGAFTLLNILQILTRYKRFLTAIQKEVAPGPRLKWYVRDLRIEVIEEEEVTP